MGEGEEWASGLPGGQANENGRERADEDGEEWAAKARSGPPRSGRNRRMRGVGSEGGRER